MSNNPETLNYLEHNENLERNENLENNDKICNIYELLITGNFCVYCWEYLGDMNGRQYCDKSRCSYDIYDEKEIKKVRILNLELSPFYSKYKNIIEKYINDKL